MRVLSTQRHQSAAQSTVEFALILPLLILLFFGLIELGILLNLYISITNSAREAARAGAIYQSNIPPPTSNSSITFDQARGQVDQQRRVSVHRVISDTINTLIDPTTQLTVTLNYAQPVPTRQDIYRSNEALTVSVEHEHVLFFKILGPRTITLRATSAMRIEPGGRAP